MQKDGTNIKDYIDDLVELKVTSWIARPENGRSLKLAIKEAFEEVMEEKLQPINTTINALIAAFVVMAWVQVITLGLLVWHIIIKS